MKRIIAMICAICTCALVIIGNGAMEVGAIEKENAIERLSRLYIMNGYEDGSYRPENKITRAEFAKMMYVLVRGTDDGGEPYRQETSIFQDVEDNTGIEWAKGYINYCSEKGYVQGKGEGRYDPQGEITIAEIGKILLKGLGYEGQYTGNGWEKTVMEEAEEAGIIEGVEGVGEGEVKATRLQAAEMISNTIPEDENISTDPNDYVVIYESWYDEVNEKAYINVVDSLGFPQHCEVVGYYTPAPEREGSYQNDKPEDFANNHKYGYIYYGKMNEEKTEIDLSYQRGAAACHMKDLGLREHEFYINNQVYYSDSQSLSYFLLNSTFPRVLNISKHFVTMPPIVMEDLVIDGINVTKPIGSVYYKQEGGKKIIIACAMTTAFYI